MKVQISKVIYSFSPSVGRKWICFVSCCWIHSNWYEPRHRCLSCSCCISASAWWRDRCYSEGAFSLPIETYQAITCTAPTPHPVPLSYFKHPTLFSPSGWRDEERDQGWRWRLRSHQEIGGESGEDCVLLCGREAQLNSAFFGRLLGFFDDGCSAVSCDFVVFIRRGEFTSFYSSNLS